jgi:uncharacterized membrane protein YraQ (UPF0718 family)
MKLDTIAFPAVSLIVLIAAYWWSPEAAIKGLKGSGNMALGALLPLLSGFLLAGVCASVVSKDLVVRWMGPGSGVKGVVTAWILGAAMPGATGVQLPLILVMADLGVGVGPLITYFSSWALIGINRFVAWEIPSLGWEMAWLRFGVSLVIPPIIGLVCGRFS